VTFPINTNKPVLSVISSSAADVGTHTCTVTAGLSLYAQTVTKAYSVVINECDLAGFTLDSSAAQSTIKEYILMGSALQVAFPTYT
jgi:myo-inositol-hexaphosphate 3-phosphohydrolase